MLQRRGLPRAVNGFCQRGCRHAPVVLVGDEPRGQSKLRLTQSKRPTGQREHANRGATVRGHHGDHYAG